MTAHKHAELMAQYAEDARETDKPWERWEFNAGGGWCPANGCFTWSTEFEYRRKPKTSRDRFDAWWYGPNGFSDCWRNHRNYREQALAAWEESERQAKELSDD